MTQRLHVVLTGVAAAAVLASPAWAQCDRACLEGMVTQYIDALAAQDPGALPLADEARFTENSVDMQLGEGVWATVTGKGAFRQDYLDTTRQIAASHFTMEENGNPVLYSLLLHLNAESEIEGVETLVQKITPESRFQPALLDRELAGMNDPVPADQRMSREVMIATALTYTEGLRIGTFVDTPTPFGAEAYRIENGILVAGKGCAREGCENIQTQTIIEHPDISASVAAVDEENSVVLLWMNFGDTNSYGEGNALVTFEAFKVYDGAIQVVHAFFPILKAETERGWPSSDPIPEWKAAGR